jgi:RNA polymerase sigma-70 factor, ECF subfamily
MPSDPVYIEEGTTGKPGEAEAEVIRRLQRGHLSALGVLFERYKAPVYRTALVITRDEHAAEDILQECFVRLHTYAASIDAERPLRPWLYRVTVNLAYDWLARKSARPLEEVLGALTDLVGSFPAPDRRAEEKETARLVHEVVAELPAIHRAVIVLFYLEELSVEEIAHALELPEGTVKSRLHYARERLREMLTQRQRVVPEMSYEFT